MSTFLQIQNRFLALVDESAISSTHKSHINYAIKDILNAFPFSWDLATTDLTLSAGTASLPSDYNPKWRIYDARDTDDNIFTEIDPKDRANYGSSDCVYWITQSGGDYTFNTTVQSGTVTIYYYDIPAELSGDSDVCIIPDAEAVAFLAASKHFIGEDQDEKLKDLYQKEADKRIQSLYTQDLNFGPQALEYSKVSQNPSLTTRGI